MKPSTTNFTSTTAFADLLFEIANRASAEESDTTYATPDEKAVLAEWFSGPYPDNGLGRHLAQFSNICTRLLNYNCLLFLLYPYLSTRVHPDKSVYSYVAGALLEAERHHCPNHPAGPIFQPHAKPEDGCRASHLIIRITSVGRQQKNVNIPTQISPAELDPLRAYQLLFGELMHAGRNGAVVEVRLPTGPVPSATEDLLAHAVLDRGHLVLSNLRALKGKALVDLPFTFLALLYLDETLAPSSVSGGIRDFFEGGDLEEALHKAEERAGTSIEVPPDPRDLENAIFVLEHLTTYMNPFLRG